MKQSVKIVTGTLGFFMLIPGLAKLTEPFKTFIFQHLEIIGFPFPDLMQYVVKYSQIVIGLTLLFLAFKGNSLNLILRNQIFYLANFSVVVMMLVAIYTHLHPDVPAAILPVQFKPPILPFGYIFLVVINFILNRKQLINC